MDRQIVFGGCHSVKRKTCDFVVFRRLSRNEEELDGLQEEVCKMKWKIKNEVEKEEIYIDNWNILASSCCADLRMKLPDTRPTSIQLLSVG
ncbi:unnamed protein product [Spirodela intermedia]|uniref:Uncharacterized protein n=1 Tax=Spirodela intermedia TaxID=51605 RepID=A0A7I8J3S7_SPIIN|nr:unnamed protein product [Spirodela intermedia]CAA6664433.1 unnamed protein product [Spirodela intermedia]